MRREKADIFWRRKHCERKQDEPCDLNGYDKCRSGSKIEKFWPFSPSGQREIYENSSQFRVSFQQHDVPRTPDHVRHGIMTRCTGSIATRRAKQRPAKGVLQPAGLVHLFFDGLPKLKLILLVLGGSEAAGNEGGTKPGAMPGWKAESVAGNDVAGFTIRQADDHACAARRPSACSPSPAIAGNVPLLQYSPAPWWRVKSRNRPVASDSSTDYRPTTTS